MGVVARASAPASAPASAEPAADTATLRAIEDRVLWLAMSIVHHANKVRPARSGVKVGGHQASSASMVSIMTALWFDFLRRPDRVSVKPHASPVLHAIHYLQGALDERYLTTLREFGGLQSYPSRVKDPDRVDFSTGSVGIGATATIWSAVAHRYLAGHFEVPVGGRQIALVGDAELDEGAVWEAVVDPLTPRLGELLWIVDLNRQSLDRVVPELHVHRLEGMFAAAGWHVQTVKYGRLLRELFEQPGGPELRRRIDQMPNEEYQRMLRSDAAELRERLPGEGRGARKLRALVSELDDDLLLRAIRDLAGHDLEDLRSALRASQDVTDRPSVLFAYTIKGWRLPTQGHPANHSALLTPTQMRELAVTLGADPDRPWERFPEGSAEERLCRTAGERMARPEPERHEPPQPPPELGRTHTGTESTQQALGRFFVDLAHDSLELARHVVTASPDVASSTNLGGWINKVGVWSIGERIDWFADDTDTLVRWRESDHGQHIELGIAEVNLAGLLGELGATWRQDGRPLLPVGTLYDPFVARALEPWSFGIYAGGQSILVGTPSGVTLAPEGGAHQSVSTPSIGIGQPGCVAWEPAFGQDFEWCFLHALGRLGRPDGESAYFRLSTRPVDQSLAAVPADGRAREARRRAAVAGGYRLRSAPDPVVTLAGVGAVMPEVLAAAGILDAGGVPCEVLCLTSPDLVFRAYRAETGATDEDRWILGELLPADRPLPIVSVLDGHPHALSFLGSVRGVPQAALGVTDFGQSGDVDDLYRHFGLDPESIVDAAVDVIA
jgi:pyruvate dehydrogenase E1 component